MWPLIFTQLCDDEIMDEHPVQYLTPPRVRKVVTIATKTRVQFML